MPKHELAIRGRGRSRVRVSDLPQDVEKDDDDIEHL